MIYEEQVSTEVILNWNLEKLKPKITPPKNYCFCFKRWNHYLQVENLSHMIEETKTAKRKKKENLWC